ncbi:MAG: hypothetical protein U9N85_08995 [Bacteroidota bacterium]|nr:hypothetical protein [Bacteroidota bacterium]
MKRTDIFIITGVLLLFTPFFISETVYSTYENFNQAHGLIAAFVKFALLATFGESLALRLKEGVYNKADFGLLPRAVVWGFLGITIKIAFVIFAKGTPAFLEYMGLENPSEIMSGDFSGQKLLIAFSISTAMNLIYAPVMMTLHKITDIHIVSHKGKISAIIRKINFSKILQALDWNTHWHFVLKKTIPFFWIPMHTVTFLMPSEFRVLFAAILGIALGLILAFAGLKKTSEE